MLSKSAIPLSAAGQIYLITKMSRLVLFLQVDKLKLALLPKCKNRMNRGFAVHMQSLAKSKQPKPDIVVVVSIESHRN